MLKRLEWSETKRQANAHKHGIDFRDLSAIFDRPMLTRFDDRKDYGEDRWIGIGFLGQDVVVVVYTETKDEIIRIISARKANRRERRRFEKNVVDGLGPTQGPVGR